MAFERCVPAKTKKEARQLVVTEAARTYLQFPVLAEILQKAAREVEGFAVDLVEALGGMNEQRKDCGPVRCLPWN